MEQSSTNNNVGILNVAITLVLLMNSMETESLSHLVYAFVSVFHFFAVSMALVTSFTIKT